MQRAVFRKDLRSGDSIEIDGITITLEEKSGSRARLSIIAEQERKIVVRPGAASRETESVMARPSVASSEKIG